MVIALSVLSIVRFGRHGAPPIPTTPPATQIAAEATAHAAAERVDYVPCWFSFPAGHSARCGTLTVPETRAAAASPLPALP